MGCRRKSDDLPKIAPQGAFFFTPLRLVGKSKLSQSGRNRYIGFQTISAQIYHCDVTNSGEISRIGRRLVRYNCLKRDNPAAVAK